MPNTYCSLNVHYVFSTKNREPWITRDLENRLWPFMGGIAKQNRMKALAVGGTSDHVHRLVSLPATVSVSKGVQLVKGPSSKWVHENFRGTHRGFSWQEGYGAFTVSVSRVPGTIAYIQGQKEHHRKKTFKEEYLAFLDRHGIDYDERYLRNHTIRNNTP